MKKKSADQIGASGIMLSARGYATNANPGPKHQHAFVTMHVILLTTSQREAHLNYYAKLQEANASK